MKDVAQGKIIGDFVGLKSKMYSIKIFMVRNLIQERE